MVGYYYLFSLNYRLACLIIMGYVKGMNKKQKILKFQKVLNEEILKYKKTDEYKKISNELKVLYSKINKLKKEQ